MFVLTLVTILVCSNGVSGTIEEGFAEWDYITCVEQAGEREYNRRRYMPYREEVIEYACIEPGLFLKEVAPTLNTIQTNWLNQLVITTRNMGLVPGIQRVRKEYRMLTDNERIAFVSAVNQLKSDTAISEKIKTVLVKPMDASQSIYRRYLKKDEECNNPKIIERTDTAQQKYDALTSLHLGVKARSAHRGPGFFTYHRLFILLFENALREYDSSVVLPYWDSTLDQPLDDPKTSILWDDAFFGTGEGIVVSGPFENWQTRGRPLIRNYGESGRLMRSSDVDKIMSKSRIGEITFPNAELENNLELHSYGVQLWVGGDMARLATAANDPLYFLIHAYTDCLWEKFRENQTDPTNDWPWRYDGNSAHSVNAFLRVVENVQSRQVLTDRYGANIYRCEEVPSCITDSDCQSQYLRCSTESNRCISRQSENQLDKNMPCQGPVGLQNNYCIDGDCSENNWVYIPVEIIYKRPPDYGKYNARPLFSPTWIVNEDIYSPLRFNGAIRTLFRQRPSNPVYRDCKCKGSDSGRAYVQSYGLDYSGSYREYVPVDRRLAISSSVAYVAVKSPTLGTSRSIIRVYDDCGRICTPVCAPDYSNCSGIVSVSSSTNGNLGYGQTFEDALYINFEWNSADALWRRIDDFFVKFYCNFEAEWPFAGMSYIADGVRPTRPTDPDERPLTTTTTTLRTTPTTTTTTTTPTTTVLVEPNNCFNSSECYGGYEPTGCISCNPGAFSPCPDDSPHNFRQCGMGSVWHIHTCPSGLIWDQQIRMCNYDWPAWFRSYFRFFK